MIDMDQNQANINMLTKLGDMLIETKCYEEAAKAYRELTDITPTDSSTWLTLGECFVVLGRDEEAIEAFHHCLEEDDPWQVPALYQAAMAYSRLGDTRRGFFYEREAARKQNQPIEPDLLELDQLSPERQFIITKATTEVHFSIGAWHSDKWGRDKIGGWSFKWVEEELFFIHYFDGPWTIGRATIQDFAQIIAERWLEGWLKSCGEVSRDRPLNIENVTVQKRFRFLLRDIRNKKYEGIFLWQDGKIIFLRAGMAVGHSESETEALQIAQKWLNDDQQRYDCLMKALAINPYNKTVKEGLLKLQWQMEQPSDKEINRFVTDLSSDNRRYRATRQLGAFGDPRAVEPLILSLADPDEYVRWNAAIALGKIGDPRAIGPLIRALRESPDVSSSVADALVLIGRESIPALLMALRDYHYSARWSAASALADLEAEEAIPLLRANLNDPNEYVRSGAKLALDTLLGPTMFSLDELIDDLNRSHIENQGVLHWLTTAMHIGELGDPKALPPLQKAFKNDADDAYKQQIYSKTIDDIKESIRDILNVVLSEDTPESKNSVDTEELLNQLDSSDYKIVSKAADALIQKGDLQIVEPLINRIQQGKSRGTVARILGGLGDLRAVDVLIPILDLSNTDEHSTLRATVVEALGKIGGARSLSVIEQIALEGRINAHSGSPVAEKAQEVAGKLRRKVRPWLIARLDEIDRLIIDLEDREVSVRLKAIRRLGILQTRRAVRPIIDVLCNDKTPSVLQEIVTALQRIGDPRAIGPLMSLLPKDQTESYTKLSLAARQAVMDIRQNIQTRQDAQVTTKRYELVVEDPVIKDFYGHDEEKSREALRILVERGDSLSVEVLTDALYRKSKRDDAFNALLEIGDIRALPAIITTMTNWPVNQLSREITPGQPPDIQTIERLIRNIGKVDAFYERRRLALILALIGEPAIEPLTQAAQLDPNQDIRTHANNALEQIMANQSQK